MADGNTKTRKDARVTCTRRLQFCSGHRVMGHENKCAHMHGHNYVVMLTAAPTANLDSIGRVVDFSVLKQEIGEWIDTHWDHRFIIHRDDGAAAQALRCFSMARHDQEDQDRVDMSPHGESRYQKVYALDCNPTAENMAKHLLEEIVPCRLDKYGVELVRVTLWETENCCATACLPGWEGGP